MPWGMPDLYEIEGAAQALRAGCKVSPWEYLTPFEMVYSARGRVVPVRARGCRGVAMPNEGVIIGVDNALPEYDRNRNGAHELGHVGERIAKWERHEPTASRIGNAAYLSPHLVNRNVRLCGYHLTLLARAFPYCPGEIMLERVALVRRAVAIVRRPSGHRIVLAGEGLENIAARAAPWEREMIAHAETTRERIGLGGRYHRDLFGVVAWALGPRHARWSVIMLSPEALDTLGGYPDGDYDLPPHGDSPANDGLRLHPGRYRRMG